MIILAVYNTEDILELSSNRICGGFFCNQIVLLLLLQYSTGDSFFWLFSSSLCLTLLAKLESGMMKVSLGVGSLPAGSTRFLPGWTARVSVVVAEELPQLYHDHPLALVLQEHYHHPPRSSCSRLLAARLTSSAREDQPAFPSRLLPVDSAWLQTPSWTIRQFTHTFIGKKIKTLVRKLFLYVFYPVDPSFCRNNLQTKPHQKLVSTGILPYREPSSKTLQL